jgi:hypothetical protein
MEAKPSAIASKTNQMLLSWLRFYLASCLLISPSVGCASILPSYLTFCWLRFYLAFLSHLLLAALLSCLLSLACFLCAVGFLSVLAYLDK